MRAKGQVLLVNPWIYDFAAYNSWIEPLGLLTVAAALRDSGYGVMVIDCLAPHAGMPRPHADGSGKLSKTVIDKPAAVAFVPRRFGRYGLPVERFEAALAAAPTTDLVLIASAMTYWYPGVVEAIRRIRTRFGSVPVALGGVYATLCPDHARQFSGADQVIAGPGVVAALRLADQITGHDSDPDRLTSPPSWPLPAHDLAARPYAAVLTSWGCPYRCTYCASHRLQPAFVQREPDLVVEEIAACVRRGVRRLAFYDDALLIDAERHLAPILEGVLARRLPVSFFPVNGLHARGITAELAVLMRRAGFVQARLSLETIDPGRQRATGAKVTTADFESAVRRLRAAGFGPADLRGYLLAALPGQPLAEIEDSLRFVLSLGIQAELTLFSPIPGTPDGDLALPPGADPLLHNNTVYPYLLGGEYVRDLQRLKEMAKAGNQTLR
ncbi:MAG: radical SAM protein [Anaerolineae bacterium]|nr:radical SAM protein [Anaerolineae bacterium]